MEALTVDTFNPDKITAISVETRRGCAPASPSVGEAHDRRSGETKYTSI